MKTLKAGLFTKSSHFFMKNIAVIILFTLLGVSCKTSSTEDFAISQDFIEIEDGYHFYTFGDWGRNGQYGQKELATMMNTAAFKVEPEFIISTGDNFYNNGVASIQDPYWLSSYENVYNGANLFCDWYVVLGNHDYRGNSQAQIDYTYVSRRWNMPSRYFLKDVETDQGVTARFVFIDTNPLNDEYYKEEKYKYEVMTQDTTSQLLWMDSVLNVDADWKIVIGHHPLYTGGKRAGEANFVRTHIEKYLVKHDVDVYFAGHEHDLQHIKVEGKPSDYIVSGAGSEVRPTGKMEHSVFAASVQGFVATTITADSLYHQFVNYKGEVIYTFSSE